MLNIFITQLMFFVVFCIADVSTSIISKDICSLSIKKKVQLGLRQENESNTNGMKIKHNQMERKDKSMNVQGNFFISFLFSNRCLNDSENYVQCANGRRVKMRSTSSAEDPSCVDKCVRPFFIGYQRKYSCGVCKGVVQLDTGNIPSPVSTPKTSAPILLSPITTSRPTSSKVISPISPSFRVPIQAPIADSRESPVSESSIPTENVLVIPVSTPTRSPTNPTIALPVPTPGTVTFSANQTEYEITLDLVGAPAFDRIIFQDAANIWNSAIPEDLSSQISNGLIPPPMGCTYPEVIDDLYICATYTKMDGPGRIVGGAGPVYVRADNYLTFTGTMSFDVDDLDFLRMSFGDLKSVILHEMGHILGIGSLWALKSVTMGNSSFCPYVGVHATAEYEKVTGCKTLPTELDGGDSIRCGHFDEECMDNELMTGVLNPKKTNSLSRITYASLQDLGYPVVDYSGADIYTSADINPNCICSSNLLEDQSKVKENVFLLHELDTEKKGQNRRLSSESYQIAYDYGQSILNSRKIEMEQSEKMINESTRSSDWIHVGADVISVLIADGESIYGVVVSNHWDID